MAVAFEAYLGLYVMALGLLSLAVSNRRGGGGEAEHSSSAARLGPLVFLALIGALLLCAYLLGIDLIPGAGLVIG
jgi:hypothetical protein